MNRKDVVNYVEIGADVIAELLSSFLAYVIIVALSPIWIPTMLIGMFVNWKYK